MTIKKTKKYKNCQPITSKTFTGEQQAMPQAAPTPHTLTRPPPLWVASFPQQLRAEAHDQVEDTPGNDDRVVQRHHRRDEDHTVPQPWNAVSRTVLK